MTSPVYFAVVFLIVGAECKTRLRDLIPICKINDPNLNECAKNSAQKLLPVLAKGVRDLNLIPLDPLSVPALDFGQESGPVSLSWKFSNASITGASSAIVKNMTLDQNGYKFEGEFNFPKFTLAGKYKGKGKILLLPINGEGFGNVTTTNMDIKMKFSCKSIYKKNVQYLSIDKLKLGFKYTKAYISFTNLFGGNKELGMATNRFLNEHSDEIVEEMRGTLEEVFAQLNMQLMNTVFENVPLSEVFQ